MKLLNDNGQKIIEAAHSKLDAARSAAEEATASKAAVEEALKNKELEAKELRGKVATLEGNLKVLQEDHNKAKLELQSVCNPNAPHVAA